MSEKRDVAYRQIEEADRVARPAQIVDVDDEDERSMDCEPRGMRIRTTTPGGGKKGMEWGRGWRPSDSDQGAGLVQFLSVNLLKSYVPAVMMEYGYDTIQCA